MAPRLRAAPWPVVLVGSAVGSLLLLLAAAAPVLAGTLLRPLSVALLAGSAAFVLDEPAAAAVDATPTSLRSRTAGRAVVALVPVICGGLALLAVAQRAPVSLRGSSMVLAGCVLVAVVTSSVLRRQRAAPGELGAAVIGLTVIAVALFEPLSRWVLVLPMSGDADWERTTALWAGAATVSVLLALWATRDPLLSGYRPVMGIFGKDRDKDSDPSTGSGEGGTLGTPSLPPKGDVPGNDDADMVVSGGGVADTSEDDAAAAGERGLG